MGDCIKPSNNANNTSLEGMLASCLTPFTSKALPPYAPAGSPTCRWFRELGHHLGGSYCVFGKAVDQGTSHLVKPISKHYQPQHGEPGVFNTLRVTPALRAATQLVMSRRDAAVFRDRRLSFSGEAGHITDDRYFLTAIQTQDTPLNALGANATLHVQRPTVNRTHIPSAAGSPSALAGLLSAACCTPTILDDL